MDNRIVIAKRAAAYFQSGDVVNLGIGIPSMCGNFAVPGVLFQSENGYIGVGPVAEGPMVNECFRNAGNVIKLRILHSVKKYPPPFLRGGYFTFWLIHIYEEYSIKNHFSIALE